MSFDAFHEALKEVPLDSNRIFHFRIATSGKIAPSVCHPYPVEPSHKAMYATDVLTSMACAHNGIITWCTPHGGLKESYSDTMAFIAGYLYPLRNEVMENAALHTLIAKSTSSKFAIMDSEEIVTIGDFIESEGIYYSNSGWKSCVYSFRGGYYGHHGYYSCDDYDYYTEKYGTGKHTKNKFYDYAYSTTKGWQRVDGTGTKVIDVTSTLKQSQDTIVPYTPAASYETVYGYDLVNELRDSAIQDGHDDPAILEFSSQDGKSGLNYVEAEDLLEFLLEGLSVEVINYTYDDVNKLLYIVTSWESIPNFPAIVCNAKWSVVC